MPELGELPVFLQQLCGRAELHYVFVLYYRHAVGAADSAQAVRYYDAGAAHAQGVEARLDSLFGHAVEGACSLVHDKYWRVLQKDARNAQPLLLAA